MDKKDAGSWLSAQQAVLPDGTELMNLPLVNKKLPPLAPASKPSKDDTTKSGVGDQN